jgi:hypothetical protein
LLAAAAACQIKKKYQESARQLESLASLDIFRLSWFYFSAWRGADGSNRYFRTT